MTPDAIFQHLQEKFGDTVAFDFHSDPTKDKDPWFQVAPLEIETLCRHLRAHPELAFDYLECITGVDYPSDKRIDVIYHLYSYSKRHRAVLKARLDRTAPVLPTIVTVWSAADWMERECFDLLGVHFTGHPDLRRLLLPDDWEGHPLRKDYAEKDNYHGIPTVRPNPIDLLKPPPVKAASPTAEAKAP